MTTLATHVLQSLSAAPIHVIRYGLDVHVPAQRCEPLLQVDWVVRHLQQAVLHA